MLWIYCVYVERIRTHVPVIRIRVDYELCYLKIKTLIASPYVILYLYFEAEFQGKLA